MRGVPSLLVPYPFPVGRDTVTANAPLSPISAAGDAIGIASAGADAQLVESAAASASGDASASAQLVESAAAIGIASAAATTEDDVENGTAVGIGAASESGAIVLAAGAATGSGSSSAAASVSASAAAIGVAIASGSLEEDVENGSAIGQADVTASAAVVGAGDAVGAGSASANTIAAIAVGEADAAAEAVVVGMGSASGEGLATANAAGSAPQPIGVVGLVPPLLHQRARRLRGAGHVMTASGHARGSSVARAAAGVSAVAAAAGSTQAIADAVLELATRPAQGTALARARRARLVASGHGRGIAYACAAGHLVPSAAARGETIAGVADVVVTWSLEQDEEDLEDITLLLAAYQ